MLYFYWSDTLESSTFTKLQVQSWHQVLNIYWVRYNMYLHISFYSPKMTYYYLYFVDKETKFWRWSKLPRIENQVHIQIRE